MTGPRETTVAFDQVSLHDAEVESVVVHPGRIVLGVSFALFGAHHPINPLGVEAIAENCSLLLEGVTGSSARLFDDTQRCFVPDPAWAQLIIAGTGIVECKASRTVDERIDFAFGGFDRGRVAWVEWNVVASSFVLRWDSVLRPWRI